MKERINFNNFFDAGLKLIYIGPKHHALIYGKEYSLDIDITNIYAECEYTHRYLAKTEKGYIEINLKDFVCQKEFRNLKIKNILDE
jgi:hypothetical protein